MANSSQFPPEVQKAISTLSRYADLNPGALQQTLSRIDFQGSPRTSIHFSVGGVKFSGGLGEIFPPRTTVNAVDPCLRANCEGPDGGCTYFHPGREIRNHRAESFVYNPGRHNCRPFGSRSRIEADLKNITAADVERYKDQITHDMCALMYAMRELNIGL